MATGEPSGEASAEARIDIPSAAKLIERARARAPTNSVTSDWCGRAIARTTEPQLDGQTTVSRRTRGTTHALGTSFSNRRLLPMNRGRFTNGQ